MSEEETADICERHGIAVRWNGACFQADLLAPHVVGGIADKAVGKTKEDAICALLKSRWGIMTGWFIARDGVKRWVTHSDAMYDPDEYASELAAVLALSDQIQSAA